tara:strand:- start:164 stop:451 length:288 start_codon:yes stop_codon:yes gene_type:complete
MALITKGKETIVEKEVSQLNNEDIEFLLNIIENSMVPGKYIGLGNIVIQKLQNQLGILSRGREEVKSSLKKFKKSSVNSETKKIRNENGELWVEE